MLAEQGNILNPIPQRRQFDVEYVETVKKILAKSTGFDLLLEIFGCRRDNPRINFLDLAGTNRPNLVFPAAPAAV